MKWSSFELIMLKSFSMAGLLAASLLSSLPLIARPNFLIIFVDDVGYGDLGCYGGKEARTPHLDRLASEGMRFTTFYAQPVCGPSRGALMTGRQPHRIGGGWKTNGDEFFISEVLKKAGYTTGCVGKWDMSKRRPLEKMVPNAQGFDHYFGSLGANDNGKMTMWENRKELYETTDMAGLTKLYTDKSIKFLEQHRDQPFFLYLAHTMMHVVIDASPEYRDRTGKGLYADTLEELDSETGRLLKKLDELGLRNNTVVLFASDNGPWSNDTARQAAKNSKHVEWTKGPRTVWGTAGPLRGAKGSTWEGGVRVPAFVRWPGKIPSGQTSKAIVSSLDVLPTFAGLAGARKHLPENRKLDGVNQSDLWLGKSKKGARNGFLYYNDGELQAVREGPWKLRLPGLKKMRHYYKTLDKGSQQTELYHLEKDPGETNDLAEHEPETVARLMKIANEAKAR